MPASGTSVYTAESLDALEIAHDDRDAFAALVSSTLETLHEGVIARYGLRPSEFRGWLSMRVPKSP